MNQKKLEDLRRYYDNTDTSDEITDAELDDTVVEAPMVGITVRLPAELLQQVREAAAGEGVKTTALIRKWIEENIQSQATSVQGRLTVTISEAVLISNDDDDAVHEGLPITYRGLALTA